MANQRLIHDAAMAMTHTLVDLVAPCLREEERQDAFNEFYVVCQAGLEAFCIQQERMIHRLNPTKN